MKEYIVLVECKVIKEIVVIAKSMNAARLDPWLGSISETDIELKDWKVLEVKENK